MSIHLKLAIATVLWGTTPTIGRVLAHYESPELLTFFRFFTASIFLFVVASKKENLLARFELSDLPMYLFLGLTGICLHNVLMFWGMEHADATRGSIIMGLISVMVAILEFVFYGIRISTLALCGIGLAFIGLAVVVSDGNISALLASGIGFGDLLLIGSALSWAIYSVISRPILERVSALDLTALACVTGTIMLVPMLVKDFSVAVDMMTDPVAITLIGLSGLLATGIGYMWYYEGVQKIGSVGTVMYVNLMPVTGILIAAITLHEVPTIASAIGGTCVVCGVILVNRMSKPLVAAEKI